MSLPALEECVESDLDSPIFDFSIRKEILVMALRDYATAVRRYNTLDFEGFLEECRRKREEALSESRSTSSRVKALDYKIAALTHAISSREFLDSRWFEDICVALSLDSDAVREFLGIRPKRKIPSAVERRIVERRFAVVQRRYGNQYAHR